MLNYKSLCYFYTMIWRGGNIVLYLRQIYTMTMLKTKNRLNMALFIFFKKKRESSNLSLFFPTEDESEKTRFHRKRTLQISKKRKIL